MKAPSCQPAPDVSHQGLTCPQFGSAHLFPPTQAPTLSLQVSPCQQGHPPTDVLRLDPLPWYSQAGGPLHSSEPWKHRALPPLRKLRTGGSAKSSWGKVTVWSWSRALGQLKYVPWGCVEACPPKDNKHTPIRGSLSGTLTEFSRKICSPGFLSQPGHPRAEPGKVSRLSW